uniref:cytochrome c oxidase subunit III n=1 Tax=Paragavialidium hainanense TaxID=3024219 RepID=UPI0023AB4894|nr:cytochrome c oxidase subunit III [Paragavialidium hainanense]WCF77142.1 cytochrome c oxidase subunit III [Paragavialidium hainanense]
MTKENNHPYHLVNYSPWPITGAIGAMIMTLGLSKWFQTSNQSILWMGVLIIMMTMIQWWRDVSRESTYQGLHTSKVMTGLRWGMILFITSEVFFFFSFFWAFFNSSLSPNIELGLMWPPYGVQPFNPMNIPLLNTMILLSSGVTVTWAHHSLMESNKTQMTQALLLTSILGLYFTILQAYEYLEAQFSIADSVYGTTFFMSTGFHGIHVMIGTSFLLVCLKRQMTMHFSASHHLGFEAAAWYWHFVDIVWLFLYLSMYWWGK